MKSSIPEILAPVGTWEMCQAAVHSGADAIYVGMPHFNARGRAADLTLEELKGMIEYCHLYGVKVFLAFNILIFQNEFEKLIPLLKEVIKLSPDAFIVQDIGLIRLIKQIAPEQAVHGSTQMTVTNFEAINLTKDLDIDRYVLGREVSLPEMKKIRDNTDAELEVFVHGALCVSYSGQCLTSERIGGRSANRGQCAQSCRLPYDLIVDGEKRELGDKKYLVSPQDLCSLEDVEALKEIGIESYKIEGRLKSPEYVASTVRAYKEKSLQNKTSITNSQLETIYSRGFFNGWMNGVDHQRLVDARYSNHHGQKVGEVASISNDLITIKTDYEIYPGDGIVLCDFSRGLELGTKVYTVKPNPRHRETTLSLSNDFELEKVASGMIVFRNSSSKIDKDIKASYANKENLKRIEISAELHGAIGGKLKLTLIDDSAHKVEVTSDAILEPAKNAPITEDFVCSEIGALGGTCFQLKEFIFNVEQPSYIHQKELKELRRRACEKLSSARTSRPAKQISDFHFKQTSQSTAQSNSPKLKVLIRDISQIEALEGLPLDTIYLDFEFGKEYGPAVEEIRNLGFKAGIATTRILKPGETGHLKLITRLKPDCILVRNLGALEFLKNCGIELQGDFSLNVTNSLTSEWLLSKGLSGLCPSYDLNQQQLLDLLEATEANKYEVTVHQYMPAFHMEHCVFAAFLSKGSSYRDCGRPCEKHRVELQEQNGATHPLKADAECRNTMFHGIPQSSARLIPELLSLNVQNFRFEALYETATELREKLNWYVRATKQEVTTDELFSALKISEKYGVSEGQLHNIGKYKDRKKTFSSNQNEHGIRLNNI